MLFSIQHAEERCTLLAIECEDVSFAKFAARFQVGRPSQNCQRFFGSRQAEASPRLNDRLEPGKLPGFFAVEGGQTLHGYFNSYAPDKSKFLALSQQ
jgi:hypothetical protein